MGAARAGNKWRRVIAYIVSAMGFALWIDKEASVAWAQGTHEYRPLGAAVVGVTDQFRSGDFRRRRKCPPRLDRAFVGLFGSLEELNEYLRNYRSLSPRGRTRQPNRSTPPYL